MKRLIYILSLLVLFSCEDEIDIDHPDGGTRYSVEGEITTVYKKYTVFLTTSTVYDGTEIPKVEGANVTLVCSDGTQYSYVEKGAGVYETIDSIQGEVGKSYHVVVEIPDGTVLQSYPETIREVNPIDSIYSKHVSDYNYVSGPPRDIDLEETGYYLFVDAQEAPGVGDSYNWRGYINGEYQSAPEQLLYATDEFVDGNYFEEIIMNFLAQLGDTVVIEQASISIRYYDYLFSLQNESIPSGGFGTPPAPVLGNIYNVEDEEKIVFGYFSASDVKAASLVIEGDKE